MKFKTKGLMWSMILVLSLLIVGGCSKKEDDVVSFKPTIKLLNEDKIVDSGFVKLDTKKINDLTVPQQFKDNITKITSADKLKNLTFYYSYTTLVGYKEGELVFADNYFFVNKDKMPNDLDVQYSTSNINNFLYLDGDDSYFGVVGDFKQNVNYIIKNDKVLVNNQEYEIGSEEDIQANVYNLNVKNIDDFINSYFISIVDNGVGNGKK